MPVAPHIVAAAAMYRQNDALLPKAFEGMTAEEWEPPSQRNHQLLPFGKWATWSGHASACCTLLASIGARPR